MKVLVATKRTQGMRQWDMSYTVDGELVMNPPVSCDCPDCPCEREMIGLGSRSGTTTFTVSDLPGFDLDTYRDLLRGELLASGWVEEEHSGEWMARFAVEHLAAAGQFEVGDVLEIGKGRSVVRRKRATPAT